MKEKVKKIRGLKKTIKQLKKRYQKMLQSSDEEERDIAKFILYPGKEDWQWELDAIEEMAYKGTLPPEIVSYCVHCHTPLTRDDIGWGKENGWTCFVHQACRHACHPLIRDNRKNLVKKG